MLYISICIFLLYLSFLYDIVGLKKYKKEMSVVSLMVLISFSGFRYHLGGDTFGYIYRFYNHEYPLLDSYTWENFEFGNDPLFALLNSLVFYFGGKFYIFQFVHAIILNFLLFIYFKRHCTYIFTCMFFYFLFCFFHYNTEILRGSMSIVICLFGNDYIIKKKWIKGYLLYFIALNFHIQTVLLLLTPLMFNIKFNFKGYLFLFISFLLIYYFQGSLIDYTEFLNVDENLEKRSELYLTSEVYGSTKKITSGFILGVTPIIYVLGSLKYLKKNHSISDMSSIEPFIFLGIFFFIISILIPIVYRYQDYYTIYFILVLSEFFVVYARKFQGLLGYRFIRSLVVFVPLFLTIAVRIWANDRYFPYTDIFQKEIVLEREKLYNGVIRPDQY